MRRKSRKASIPDQSKKAQCIMKFVIIHQYCKILQSISSEISTAQVCVLTLFWKAENRFGTSKDSTVS